MKVFSLPKKKIKMKNKSSFFFVFLIGISIFSISFAAEVFYGTLDQDLYYNDQVLIDGIQLPQEQDVTDGVSTVSIAGSGSLTVGNRSTKGNLNLTVLGGTTIESHRTWGENDKISWWEGLLNAPQKAQIPNASNVSFTNASMHSLSRPYPAYTFAMGLENEEFQFSPAARFVFPVDESEGTKLWLAFKDLTPFSVAKWTIDEGNFCVVHDGLCVVNITNISSVTLVREFFTSCPRSKYSDTKLANGVISGPPLCTIQCDRGFTLNDDLTKCIAQDTTAPLDESAVSTGGTDTSPGGTDFQNSAQPQKTYEIRPGFFKYQDPRAGYDRYLDPSNSDGKEKVRINRQNASLLETLGQEKKKWGNPSQTDIDNSKKQQSDFMNFYQKIFGGRNDNVYGTQTDIKSENDTQKAETNSKGGPLLPSTGAGLFLSLTILGVGLMIFSYHRKSI